MPPTSESPPQWPRCHLWFHPPRLSLLTKQTRMSPLDNSDRCGSSRHAHTATSPVLLSQQITWQHRISGYGKLRVPRAGTRHAFRGCRAALDTCPALREAAPRAHDWPQQLKESTGHHASTKSRVAPGSPVPRSRKSDLGRQKEPHPAPSGLTGLGDTSWGEARGLLPPTCLSNRVIKSTVRKQMAKNAQQPTNHNQISCNLKAAN